MEIIQILVGLILVYLTLSLLITTINEIFSSLLQLRGKLLKKGIQLMLKDLDVVDGKSVEDLELWEKFAGSPLIEQLKNKSKDNKFLSLIISDKEGEIWPSYISPQVFADVVTQILRGGEIEEWDAFNAKVRKLAEEKNNKTLKWIATFLEETNQEVEDKRKRIVIFKDKLKTWFNESMQQVSSWYKHTSQIRVFIFGAIIAIGFNADSIQILTQLSKDDSLRAELVAQAYEVSQDAKFKAIIGDTTIADNTGSKTDSALAQLQKAIDNYNITRAATDDVYAKLGMGWGAGFVDDYNIRKNLRIENKLAKLEEKQLEKGGTLDKAKAKKRISTWFTIGFVLTKFMGLVITSLALSLGAPFWFDLLKKFVNIRGVGKHQAAN